MMTKKELKIEQYHSFRPTKYSNVEHLQIDQELFVEKHLYQLSLVVTLRSAYDSDAGSLVLSFSKVRNLQLSAGISAIQLSFLNIVPVDGHLEDINYKVFNDEQDIEFSFLCDDFEVILV